MLTLMPKGRALHKDQRGLATIEMIPIMIVIAILLNFALGFFGAIQTGILNSIAARNYAFETFRHRSNLMYFHDVRGDAVQGGYRRYNARVHGIASENRGNDTSSAIATTRNIGFGLNPDNGEDASRQEHDPSGNSDAGFFSIREGERNESLSATPIWIRPMYGICLNTRCSQ